MTSMTNFRNRWIHATQQSLELTQENGQTGLSSLKVYSYSNSHSLHQRNATQQYIMPNLQKTLKNSTLFWINMNEIKSNSFILFNKMKNLWKLSPSSANGSSPVASLRSHADPQDAFFLPIYLLALPVDECCSAESSSWLYCQLICSPL